MEVNKVWAVLFSPTGGTDKAAMTIAEELAAKLDVPLERVPFTRPVERARDHSFGPGDLVLAASPTYAGKLPNKILPDWQSRLRGNGALAVAVVTFGNRAYDNALAELCATLEGDGFHTVAGGAFVCRHAFTDELAYGRPGWDDLRQMRAFAADVAEKVKGLTEPPAPVAVSGAAAAPYYTPLGDDGQPVNFLKAKPQTDLRRCTHCGACARLCPMGAIDPANEANVPGTCIKCQCCVRKCTKGAKFFDDPAFLSHVAMLKRDHADPKENEVFL